MKVNKLPKSWIRFDSLSYGKVFRCDANMEGGVYLKMTSPTGVNTNAVNLESGEQVTFANFEKVKPMNGSFTETVTDVPEA